MARPSGWRRISAFPTRRRRRSWKNPAAGSSSPATSCDRHDRNLRRGLLTGLWQGPAVLERTGRCRMRRTKIVGLLAVGLALTPLAAGAKSEGPEHPTEAAARARPLPMPQRERELIDIFQTARTAYLSRKPPKLSAKDARVGLQVGVIGFMQHG